MGRLTIDEVIEHCNRHTNNLEKCYTREMMESVTLSSAVVKKYWEHRQVAEWLEELKEYKDLEEQGLLLRLPCKFGTKVYYVQKCLAPSCKECRGFLKVNNCYCDYKTRIFEQYFEYRHLKAFWQSVFLTKEEAEAALKEMEK